MIDLKNYKYKAFYSNFLNSGKRYELSLEDFGKGNDVIFINYRGDTVSAHNHKPFLVAGLGLSADSVITMLKQSKIGKNGRAMLVTADGNIQIKGDNVHLTSQLLKQHKELITKQPIAAHKARFSIDDETYYIGSMWMPDLNRFIVIEIPKSEIIAPVWKHLISTSTFIFAFLILILVVSNLFISRLARSITRSVTFVQTIAAGDFTQEIQSSQNNEIGAMTDAMNLMAANLRKKFSDIVKGINFLTNASQELSKASTSITSNSEKTTQKAVKLSVAADKMLTNMDSVENATKQTTENINQIVSAAEEMSENIKEIVEKTAHGSQTTTLAVEKARAISTKVAQLGQAASEITKVTESIAEISNQTNLLSLNATIEAARAGDAGKGFAVVAAEIKSLAEQTARATTEIEEKINSIQSTTNESVEAIQSIVDIINQVDDIVTIVAGAIEDQSQSTQEIAANVSQSAAGLEQIQENIGLTSVIAQEVGNDIENIKHATQEVNGESQQVLSSADQLSQFAVNLNELTSQYKI